MNTFFCFLHGQELRKLPSIYARSIAHCLSGS
jgi:hypothetical protein